MPAAAVNNLFLTVSMRRYAGCIIDRDQLHGANIPNSNGAIVRTSCKQILFLSMVIKVKNGFWMSRFGLEINPLFLQIIYHDGAIFESDCNLVFHWKNILNAWRPNFKDLARLSRCCIPNGYHAKFLTWSHEITWLVRSPKQIRLNCTSWVESLFYARSVIESVKADQANLWVWTCNK